MADYTGFRVGGVFGIVRRVIKDGEPFFMAEVGGFAVFGLFHAPGGRGEYVVGGRVIVRREWEDGKFARGNAVVDGVRDEGRMEGCGHR